jgi:hypothetical protein
VADNIDAAVGASAFSDARAIEPAVWYRDSAGSMCARKLAGRTHVDQDRLESEIHALVEFTDLNAIQ